MGHEPNELPLVNSLDCPTPTLRRELAFRPQTFSGKQCYVVEDPVTARFFRVGLAEYSFISRLNGHRTIGEALASARQARGQCEFTPTDALAICQWVVRSGLAHDESAEGTGLAPAGTPSAASQRRGGRISPLSIQIPLFHPDRFFQRLTPWFSWLFSCSSLVVWVLVVGWAVRDLAVHHHRLAAASTGILAANNWVWLGIVWVLLKILHECGHAIACKRCGGEVREAGVIFILLAPLAYVDVTSSWRLQSKWARIAVASAGMYVELFLAAMAALVWVRVAPGALSQICMNVMMTASVMTVLFNANPLMRFDGYYILSDFLELPNLYSSGQQYVRHLVRKYLFGMRSVASVAVGPRGAFIRIYGVLSWGWRNLVFFGLVLTAATLLQGAGIVVSVIAILFWLASLVRRLVHFVGNKSNEQPNWLRFAVVGGGISGAAIVALTCVPWPGSMTAPAIVQYSGEAVIRTECDGFIRKVRVQGGSHVDEGQVLVEMFNDQLDHELADLELEIQQSRIQRRIHQRQKELAKAQAESKRLWTLEQQYDEKCEELEQLIVRAPCAGKVVGRNLSALEGTYLTQGSHLLSIGNETAKEVRLSIAQQDMLDFRNRTGATMRVYFSGANVLESTLTRVEPRASSAPIDLSLCAPNGGELAVRSVATDNEKPEGHPYELLSPRFTGVVSLSAAQSRQAHAGQRARVALRPSETVGEHFYYLLVDWVDTKLRRRHHRS